MHDTIRHGRFITIAEQSKMAFIAFKSDAYKVYSEIGYSVPDTTDIQYAPLFSGGIKNRQIPKKSDFRG